MSGNFSRRGNVRLIIQALKSHSNHKLRKNLVEKRRDQIGLTVEGDLFVACNECGFPTCRPCYEYERRERTQNCPQCKTRYKRLIVLGPDDDENGRFPPVIAGGHSRHVSGEFPVGGGHVNG